VNDLTLSIEVAVSKGSLSISDSEAEIDRSIGPSIGRAESLLPEIFDLLRRNQIDACDLVRVAVSLGPGSYTGIKIGISTAMGLSKALSIECIGATATESMLELSADRLDTICAVPIGRDMVCAHRFDLNQNEVGDPSVITISDLQAEADGYHRQLIVHHSLWAALGSLTSSHVIDAGENLAFLVSRRAIKDPASNIIRPVYARAA
jgi:tRNA threonylcarbamoyl adenosine modification protein YeaZ